MLVEILPQREVGVEGVTSKDQDAKQWMAKLTQSLRQAGAVSIGYPVGFAKGKGQPAELYHDRAHLHHRGHEIYARYLTDQLKSHSVQLRNWSGGRLAKLDGAQ